jgi:hypothetical protein
VKGLVRIGGALGVGFVIILAALVVNDASSVAPEGAVVVSKAPERNYINAQDSDGDGVKDWEENLQGKVFETIDTPTSTAYTVPTPEEYEPPTTFTGKFSEAFFQDYLQGKINGEDFSDPTKFVGNAVVAIEKNTQSKTHSRLELTVIQTTTDTVRTYGNEIASIIRSHSINNENEAIILQKALAANDPEILKELEPIHAVYKNSISDALRINVPDVLADEHVAFLNACEAILTDIEAMRVAFTDPLYSLARMKSYETDAKALFSSLKSIGSSLSESGATYHNNEPGAFFYIFEVL